jgi:hypothetical protein
MNPGTANLVVAAGRQDAISGNRHGFGRRPIVVDRHDFAPTQHQIGDGRSRRLRGKYVRRGKQHGENHCASNRSVRVTESETNQKFTRMKMIQSLMSRLVHSAPLSF